MQNAGKAISYGLLAFIFVGVCFVALNVKQKHITPDYKSGFTAVAERCAGSVDILACVRSVR